ncbi:MAG: SIS domain-containing protein [Canibacter sp.]
MSPRIPYSEAIVRQPELLTVATDALEESFRTATISPWKPGETVAILAMGASSNSAHALVTALAQHGVRAINFTASEVTATPASFIPGDHVVLVSESGRSPEPIDAVRDRNASNTVAITNFRTEKVSEVADNTVSYGGIDDSKVYTSGYIATLLAYAGLMDAAGLESGFDYREGARVVENALARHTEAAKKAAELFDDVRSVDLIARGMGFASATQGALGFREALRVPATGWDTYQYIHGPLESMTPGSLVIALGDEREVPATIQLAEAGVSAIALAFDAPELENNANVTLIALENRQGWARVIEETVVLQLITNAVAERQNIDISEFLYSQPDTKLPESSHAE